jgi:membrane protein implicated in regulation of membrane protease activity
MLALTIALGITLMICARAVAITDTWLGTSAAAAVVMLLTITALPDCQWLLQSGAGLAITTLLWAIVTTFYHRLLSESAPLRTDSRRQTPTIELQRRHVYGWSFGRYQVGIAVGVTA